MTPETLDIPSDALPDGVAERTVSKNGVIRYLDVKGFHHNPDGPAVIHPDRATYWLVTGRDPCDMPNWWFGQRWWFRHGACHRTDGPAVELGDSTVEYWVNGISLTQQQFYQRYPASQETLTPDYSNMTRRFTENLPDGVASRKVDSEGVIEYWDAENRLHNPVGPALIHPDKATFWMVTGRDPSEKAAWWFGYQAWLRHGRLHRTDGPAFMRGDGITEYWVEGLKLSEKEFHRKFPDSRVPNATNDQP